jgi:hypothetical protein
VTCLERPRYCRVNKRERMGERKKCELNNLLGDGVWS